MPAPQSRFWQSKALDAGSFQPEISSFRLHLAAEGKAAKTVRTYVEAVQWFAAAHLPRAAGRPCWEEVRRQDVQEWIVSHPRGVRGRVGNLGVAGYGPLPDALVFPGGQVRAEVVADDRDPHLRRAQAAHVAAELQELDTPLAFLDVPVHLVRAQLQGGEQVPHPAGAVVGGPQPSPRCLAGGRAVPPRRAHCRPGRGCRFRGPNSSTR